MVRWVVGSILHGVDPLSYFSFQPVLHDWCNKGRGMCYPVYGKEGNVSFNDELNTFYLRLYGVRHMVKDHSDSEKGNQLPPHRLFFPISSKGSFICTSHRQDSTYHGFCYVLPCLWDGAYKRTLAVNRKA